MRRGCRERFLRRRLQRKPLVSDPGMRRGTCVTHVPWCMSGSLTRGDRRGIRSRHSRRMRNPQFYVSGNYMTESPALLISCFVPTCRRIYRRKSVLYASQIWWNCSLRGFSEGLLWTLGNCGDSCRLSQDGWVHCLERQIPHIWFTLSGCRKVFL